MATWEPCSEHCPAVTGKSYGSVRFCAMAERERHRSWSPNQGDDHEDYTDCCANFQCCADLWVKAGLSHVAAELIETASGGVGGVVGVSDPDGPTETPEA